MKTRYSATMGGEARDVTVEALGNERFFVTIGDESLELEAHEVGRGQYQLLHQGAVRDVVITGKAPNLSVHDRTGSYAVEILDEDLLARRSLLGGAGKMAGDPRVVTAPMPGKVVKALVEVGAEIVEGQGVIVVEAMKMENELRASADGVIKEILVEAGQSVDAGQALVVID